MATHRLVYNVSGQTLTHIPASYQASATYELHDMQLATGSAGRVLTSGSANLDSAATTLAEAAGPDTEGGRTLYVNSTTGFVAGHTYQIVSGSGEFETFVLEGVESGLRLTARHPLIAAYPVDSTVRGVELVTDVIPDATVQNESAAQTDEPMRVVWTYADGTLHQEIVRLVRHTDADDDVERIKLDIREVWPDVATRLQHEGRDTLTGHVEASLAQLRTKLDAMGIPRESFLIGDQGRWAAVWYTLHNLASIGNTPANTTPESFQSFCYERFNMFWPELTVGNPAHETMSVEPVSDSAAGKQPINIGEIITLT